MFKKATEVETYLEEIDLLLANGDYSDALMDRLMASIEVCPWSVLLREKRSIVYEMLGQYQSAVSDIK